MKKKKIRVVIEKGEVPYYIGTKRNPLVYKVEEHWNQSEKKQVRVSLPLLISTEWIPISTEWIPISEEQYD